MNLFQQGAFQLHSGDVTSFKIDCDALTDEDIEAIASVIVKLVPPFGYVAGIPTGGTRLAFALKQYALEGLEFPRLIVDDVLTTGSSMELERQRYDRLRDLRTPPSIGAVIFARGYCPEWIWPLFTMNASI